MAKWQWEIHYKDITESVGSFPKAVKRIQEVALGVGGRCYVSKTHERQMPDKGEACLTYPVKEPFKRRKPGDFFPDAVLFDIELVRMPLKKAA